MIGLGTLSLMEDAQALIKNKVGEFLQAEQKLRRMLTNESASIRAEAAGLLAAQKVLEGDLSIAQTIATQFQQGAWSLDKVFTLGDIGTRMVKHLNDVTSLEQRALGVTPSTIGLSMPSMAVIGAAAVAGVALLFVYGSKSRS